MIMCPSSVAGVIPISATLRCRPLPVDLRSGAPASADMKKGSLEQAVPCEVVRPSMTRIMRFFVMPVLLYAGMPGAFGWEPSAIGWRMPIVAAL